MGLQFRQKLSSLGPLLAIDAPSPTGSYLRRFDFELQAATRPGDGLALLARGGFDAVILDVMLPEIDGFEVCRRIRQLAGSASAIV